MPPTATESFLCACRYDIVVWGWSQVDLCFQEHRYRGDRFATEPILTNRLTQGHNLNDDQNCNDGGASIFIPPRCPFGAE